MALANAKAAGEFRDQGKKRQALHDTCYTAPGPELQKYYPCSYSQDLPEFLGQSHYSTYVNELINL